MIIYIFTGLKLAVKSKLVCYTIQHDINGTQFDVNILTTNFILMKKIIYLTLIFTLFLFSCSPEPEASFYIEQDKVKIGQEVFFHNTSQNAETYEWDFGDGYISTDKHPVYKYKLTGKYDVTLSAFSKKGKVNKSMMTLDIIEPSLLVVEVLEYWDEYAVAGASVILYPSISDWDNQKNAIVEGFTDDDGIVVFADLDPIIHYVDVWEQNHDNYQLKEEDVGFITTQKIVPDKIQWFVAWVDYVEHPKGTARGEKSMVIKKLERKVEGKIYPDTYKGSKEYQDLLKKSVRRK
jgi:PKD repeat protein